MKKGVLYLVIIGMLFFLPRTIHSQEKSYIGIGARFAGVYYGGLYDYGITTKVYAVLKNGPADRAGLRVGDGVLKIGDGDRTYIITRTNYREAVEMIIGGDERIPVTVVIVRRDFYGFLREQSLEIVREKIFLTEDWYRPE